MSKKLAVISGIFFIIVLMVILVFIFPKENEKTKLTESNNPIDVEISQMFILGRNFNLTGSFDLKEEIKLLKLYIGGNSYNVDYQKEENNVSFKTDNSNVNKTIVLDNIESGSYELKLLVNDILYPINIEYKDSFEYYTLTDITTKKNNKINIEANEKITINVENSNLPEDIYDIVIDPGHGGTESGAVYKNIIEKDYTLKISLLLKEYLEKLGYKVIISRYNDYVPDEKNDPYGDGRTSLVYKHKAKYYFAIHLNSYEIGYENQGVEIYTGDFVDFELARLLAKNITSEALTIYSTKIPHQVENGVYVRNFMMSDIEYLQEYEKITANITTNTQYYFAVRETGGKAAGAFRPENNYKNSNYGAEGYLVELGYIPSSTDYNNIIKNYYKYAVGIGKGISEYLNNKSHK